MDEIYTLQEFMLHTKSITYILMGLGVLALCWYWWFLSAKDREQNNVW